jgi:tRNA (guanine37-N1)-methyltransferase
MIADIVTIFPRMVEAALAEGVLAKAREKGILDVKVRDLRDFTDDRHRTVDDVPYGGGPGMVMKPEPFFRAMDAIIEERGHVSGVILLSPQGERLTHDLAARLSRRDNLVFLCGRYEGIDERVTDAFVTDELSIGDYVLTGGELPALVVLDAVARLIPGVVGDAASVEEDSFACGLLDHPQYTRPAEFRSRAVPQVLLSGHHGAIERWRRRERVRRTWARRPDLLDRATLSAEDEAQLADMDGRPEEIAQAADAGPRHTEE